MDPRIPIWVVARRQDWVYLKEAVGNNEGWAHISVLGDLKVPRDCIKLDWSPGGIRIKNICDRDIAEMSICLAKGQGRECRTNWQTIDGLAAGQGQRFFNLPKPRSSWWYRLARFEPARIVTEGSSRYCE